MLLGDCNMPSNGNTCVPQLYILYWQLLFAFVLWKSVMKFWATSLDDWPACIYSIYHRYIIINFFAALFVPVYTSSAMSDQPNLCLFVCLCFICLCNMLHSYFFPLYTVHANMVRSLAKRHWIHTFIYILKVKVEQTVLLPEQTHTHMHAHAYCTHTNLFPTKFAERLSNGGWPRFPFTSGSTGRFVVL